MYSCVTLVLTLSQWIWGMTGFREPGIVPPSGGIEDMINK